MFLSIETKGTSHAMKNPSPATPSPSRTLPPVRKPRPSSRSPSKLPKKAPTAAAITPEAKVS